MYHRKDGESYPQRIAAASLKRRKPVVQMQHVAGLSAANRCGLIEAGAIPKECIVDYTVIRSESLRPH